MLKFFSLVIILAGGVFGQQVDYNTGVKNKPKSLYVSVADPVNGGGCGVTMGNTTNQKNTLVTCVTRVTAGNTPAVLVFPPGKVAISGWIIPNNNVTIKGAGPGNRVSYPAFTEFTWPSGSSDTFQLQFYNGQFAAVHNMTVDGIQFNGGGVAQTNLWLYNSGEWILNNLSFTGYTTRGLMAEGSGSVGNPLDLCGYNGGGGLATNLTFMGPATAKTGIDIGGTRGASVCSNGWHHITINSGGGPGTHQIWDKGGDNNHFVDVFAAPAGGSTYVPITVSGTTATLSFSHGLTGNDGIFISTPVALSAGNCASQSYGGVPVGGLNGNFTATYLTSSSLQIPLVSGSVANGNYCAFLVYGAGIEFSGSNYGWVDPGGLSSIDNFMSIAGVWDDGSAASVNTDDYNVVSNWHWREAQYNWPKPVNLPAYTASGDIFGITLNGNLLARDPANWANKYNMIVSGAGGRVWLNGIEPSFPIIFGYNNGAIGSISAGGMLNMIGGYMNNGVQGFTGTKTAGSCTLTISGGIITGVSGC